VSAQREFDGVAVDRRMDVARPANIEQPAERSCGHQHALAEDIEVAERLPAICNERRQDATDVTCARV